MLYYGLLVSDPCLRVLPVAGGVLSSAGLRVAEIGPKDKATAYTVFESFGVKRGDGGDSSEDDDEAPVILTSFCFRSMSH